MNVIDFINLIVDCICKLFFFSRGLNIDIDNENEYLTVLRNISYIKRRILLN